MNSNADSMGPPEHGSCPCPDCCLLPADGHPVWLLDKATLIWCGDYFAELAKEMGNDVADECSLSFAYGFEKGLVMAMLKPEWTQGFYLKLREHLPDDTTSPKTYRSGKNM